MKRGVAKVLAICLFVANVSLALAKEPPGKKQAKKDYSGQLGCLARLRLESLDGQFKLKETNDGFENSELAFGLECAYRYRRLKLFSGLEFAIGDLYLHHEDDVLDVDLYALQRSWKGWLGLGIAATKKLEFSTHIGYRWLPETDIRIVQLLYAYSEYYDWDLSNISRKHTDVFGSVGVWEVGGKVSYHPARPLTLSLGVMWQRYSLEIEAFLDEYAQEQLRIFGNYLEKNIGLDSEADIVLFVPEAQVCPFQRVCAAVSFPVSAMSENAWIRGVAITFSAPLF